LRTKRLPYNKAHMKAIVSWCNILIDKLTLINDRNRLFQLFSNLESKKTKTRLISNIVLSVYVGILRANNICHCVHTYTSIYLCVYIYIYTLVWLHLMCPDGLDLNLFTHTQPVSFSIRLRCLDVTRDKWTIEMRKHHWCEWNFFLLCNTSSSLHLSFLVMIHVWLNSCNVLI
jgi:hypothetical protein